MKFDKKTIGILGGMGPDATADLYLKIIRICQRKYEASFDEDYPPIIIYSTPVPEIISNIKKESLPVLVDGVKKLESSGADFIIIPCNTAHYFLQTLKKNVSILILSMIEETVKRIKKKKYNKVGLLATDTTIKEKLYEKPLSRNGIDLIKPDKESQAIVMKIVRNVTAGKKIMKDKKELMDVVKKLKSKDAEAVILGCTELPLVINQNDFNNIEIFDATEILAESAVKKSYGE